MPNARFDIVRLVNLRMELYSIYEVAGLVV